MVQAICSPQGKVYMPPTYGSMGLTQSPNTVLSILKETDLTVLIQSFKITVGVMVDAGFPRRVPHCPRSCCHGPWGWLRFFHVKVVKQKGGIQRGGEFSCLHRHVMITRLAAHKLTQSVVRCHLGKVHMLLLSFLKKQYFAAFGRMKSLLEGSVSSLICSTLGELVHKLLWGFSEGGSGSGAHSLNPVDSGKVVLLRIPAFLFFLSLHFLP